MRPVVGSLMALLLAGCGTGGSDVSGPSGECDLSVETLPGRTFVMAEAMPDGKTVNNPQARVRFYEADGVVKADYTVKSLSDVYTYECETVREGELKCVEPPRLEDWCRALEVHEKGSCTAKTLRELGADGASKEELSAAIDKAVAQVDEYRGGDQWQQFVFANNNLGNKLQGILYARPKTRRCNVVLNDMYMTIHDGQKKEDSNPVGTNAFVEVEDAYLFEHCTDSRNLVDLSAPERVSPDQIPPQRQHATGQAIHFLYYGESAVEPEEGCTYGYDSYAQWRPVDKGVEVTPGDDGKLDWRASHTFSESDGLELTNPQNPIGVFTMVRHKTCGGDKETIDVVCSGAVVR